MKNLKKNYEKELKDLKFVHHSELKNSEKNFSIKEEALALEIRNLKSKYEILRTNSESTLEKEL